MKSDAARWGPDAPTHAQLKEFFDQIRSGRVTRDTLQRFLRHGASEPVMMPLRAKKADKLIVGSREKAATTVADWLSFWTKLYKEHFGIELDTSVIRIPEQRPSLNWMIVVARGLTPNRIFDVMQKFFLSWHYTENLDTITSVRKTDQTYAIWVRDRVEADEEFKNKSADDLNRAGMNCMTLEERMLLGIMHFVRTGTHLDVEKLTLCAGSRAPDGGVPRVYWGPDNREVCVHWTSLDYRSGNIRAREVVS